jgi:hypothetical protein
VLFTNKRWLTESVSRMQGLGCNILQPFEYCVHMEKDELEPKLNMTWCACSGVRDVSAEADVEEFFSDFGDTQDRRECRVVQL